jgi:hypothetical protein
VKLGVVVVSNHSRVVCGVVGGSLVRSGLEVVSHHSHLHKLQEGGVELGCSFNHVLMRFVRL